MANIRDLAKLANIADLIGYTDFDGTHFTADGYEPVAMTAYTATMKRLHKGHMRNVTNGRALSYVLRDGA